MTLQISSQESQGPQEKWSQSVCSFEKPQIILLFQRRSYSHEGLHELLVKKYAFLQDK